MPILAREFDLYPEDLLDRTSLGEETVTNWWALYTISRREKELMRRLRAWAVPFYGPITAKCNRSPSGRVRTSYVPLFPNYVFMYADASCRHTALTTNCVSRTIKVRDGAELTRNLRQIYRLIESGVPLTAEARLQPGRRVRIRSGALYGQEGMIIRRQGKTHLVVAVNFLQQGASVLLEDFEVESVD